MNGSDWWRPPRTPEGATDLIQVARDLAHRQAVVGQYVTDCQAIISEMRLELPRSGSLVLLFEELAERLEVLEATWVYADDALLTTAQLVEIECQR